MNAEMANGSCGGNEVGAGKVVIPISIPLLMLHEVDRGRRLTKQARCSLGPMS